MNRQELRKQVKSKFEDGITVEEAITSQVNAAVENMTREFQRQQRYGECRSIRCYGLINCAGGKFVFDLRLLPDAEVADDELIKIVVKDIR